MFHDVKFEPLKTVSRTGKLDGLTWRFTYLLIGRSTRPSATCRACKIVLVCGSFVQPSYANYLRSTLN